MSTHKHFDKICCVVAAVAVLITVLFVNANHFGIQKSSSAPGYANRLFDTSFVHTIDIVMDDWDAFIETCTNEEYAACGVLIDGEAYNNVAIRAKGNTSLSQVEFYGNDRYSFKIEFDHYNSAMTYYGLDKLCLNNIIQDNTYIKDYLTYQMMNEMGTPSPLCSFVNISVNGSVWGLYLAIEGVEEAFLKRNFGSSYGKLYKPDSMNMGGGRGNGRDFEMDRWQEDRRQGHFDRIITPEEAGAAGRDNAEGEAGAAERMPKGAPGEGGGSIQNDIGPNHNGNFMPDGEDPGKKAMDGWDPGKMAMGSDDVLLKYIDDNPDSYANIFENAKTDISDSDKERLIESLKRLNDRDNLSEILDIESVIRYFAVHNFVLNFDSYTGSMIHNYYLYEKDGQMSMIPWDYNLAFGAFENEADAESLINYPIDSPVSGGDEEERPMLAWIFEDEEYLSLYHYYLDKFISEFFDSGKFTSMIESVKALISPYIENDPTKFCSYEEFITGIDTLQEFCLLRAESIAGQLDGTIGSTQETQNRDTFIRAGDIAISAMGSNVTNHGEGMRTGGAFREKM